MESGAAGFVAKGVSADRLVAALERVVAGERVVETGGDEDGAEAAQGDWPWQREGLTQRESEVLVLICRGLSSEEVAGALFLSVNTVKTCIRSCYRRIGVASRSRAVIWGLDHDLAPRAQRRRPRD